MASRDYERAPGRLQVEFRSPTALLVAYSVDLSRGGMFIQCDEELPAEGTPLALDITLPDRSVVSLSGVVAWQRAVRDETGPRGVGVQFDTFHEELGATIDRLVLSYSGIRILVQCADPGDRKTLLRRLKSIVGTAEVVFANDDSEALGLLQADTDLVLVDVDEDERAALATLRYAHEEYDIPAIALSEKSGASAELTRQGADEILGNPPNSAALRKAVLGLLSSPRRTSLSQP